MYISQIKIDNFRNFRSLDVPLKRKTILLGENNSGKTNFIRALTLPLSSSEIGGFRKKLHWDDINKECRDEYIEFIRNNQSSIINGTVSLDDFVSKIPFVQVTLFFTPDPDSDDFFYLKDFLSELTSESEVLSITYKYYIKDSNKLLERVKEVLQSTKYSEDTEHSLLPLEWFTTEILRGGSEKIIGFGDLQKFNYALIPAERDDFSSDSRNIGSRLFVRLMSNMLDGEKNTQIESAYHSFFENIRSAAKVDDLINWQNISLLENARDFYSQLELQPNMPNLYSILYSAKLGLKNGPLSGEGLGYRNLIFLSVLLNAVATSDDETKFSLVLIDEVEAHLSQSNQLVLNSFMNSDVIKNNKKLQLVFDTHSLNFINKENLENIVIITNGNAFAFSSYFSSDDLNYLSRNPNLDIYKYLFSKQVILVEGPSEELLLRAYLNSRGNLINQVTILSFHKGFAKAIESWKSINENNQNKMAIIRDFDNEPNAQTEHEKLNSKNVKSFTTQSKTLEKDILNKEDNFALLNTLFSSELDWKLFSTSEELFLHWEKNKLTGGLLLAQQISMGLLPDFKLPDHLDAALNWLGCP